jgi:hypothetical protein
MIVYISSLHTRHLLHETSTVRDRVFIVVLCKLPSKFQVAVVSTLGVRYEYCNRHCLVRIQERKRDNGRARVNEKARLGCRVWGGRGITRDDINGSWKLPTQIIGRCLDDRLSLDQWRKSKVHTELGTANFGSRLLAWSYRSESFRCILAK